MITLTTEETQFLVNLLLCPDVAAPVPDEVMSRKLAAELIVSPSNDFNPQELAFLQYILQMQNEIWGIISTPINEKQSSAGHTFHPHQTLVLINSIGIKLGMRLPVDTTLHSDLHGPREEGSRSIMKDPTL